MAFSGGLFCSAHLWKSETVVSVRLICPARDHLTRLCACYQKEVYLGMSLGGVLKSGKRMRNVNVLHFRSDGQVVPCSLYKIFFHSVGHRPVISLILTRLVINPNISDCR